MIPFWAISLWFFYRKAKLNYIERIVVAIYMTSEGLWLTILMLGVFAATGQLLNMPAFVISSLYYGYSLNKSLRTKTISFHGLKQC